MTAFLMESYKGLQDDYGVATVRLLTEIAEQGRPTIPLEASTLNVAGPAPPFVPPSWAVRVNVLWFASLSFSLIAASFAMMVKQWLREYLSDGQSGAQSRLRIRHFRLAGITSWKVFEIAALLPILLQLSLGLFLVGLCFFAWSVHPSVGTTCVPLVALWGLCIVLSSSAPVWWPQCPYKIPFLKGTLGRIRRSLRKFVLDVPYALQLLREHWRTRGETRAPSPLDLITGFSPEPLTWSNRPHRDPTDPYYEAREEAWAASDAERDLEILAATDAYFQDDDLLEHAILDAAWEWGSNGDFLVRFIVDAVHRRYPYADFSPDALPTTLVGMSDKMWQIMAATSELNE